MGSNALRINMISYCCCFFTFSDITKHKALVVFHSMLLILKCSHYSLSFTNFYSLKKTFDGAKAVRVECAPSDHSVLVSVYIIVCFVVLGAG